VEHDLYVSLDDICKVRQKQPQEVLLDEHAYMHTVMPTQLYAVGGRGKVTVLSYKVT
jgi:hypothetical protein